jgi:hypothetical protein
VTVLPYDLTEIVLAELRKSRRPNDGLLHASSHLTGSLRHAQLEVVGAPKVESELLSEITLMTGTMWHTFLHKALVSQGVPYMAEVNMTPWLPLGWGGTLDGLFLNPELKAFVIADFKTIKGEGVRFIERDGAKQEHIWQTSLYWHGAKKMLSGTARLAKTIAVYYLPKNDTRNKDEFVEPVLVDFEPIPLAQITKTAEYRAERVAVYRDSLGKPGSATPDLSFWLTDELEPVQERQQVVYFDRKTETWDVLLKPHWTAAYCPFPEELCDCNKQGQTKIGMYDTDGDTYIPREGYEDIVPVVHP